MRFRASFFFDFSGGLNDIVGRRRTLHLLAPISERIKCLYKNKEFKMMFTELKAGKTEINIDIEPCFLEQFY